MVQHTRFIPRYNTHIHRATCYTTYIQVLFLLYWEILNNLLCEEFFLVQVQPVFTGFLGFGLGGNVGGFTARWRPNSHKDKWHVKQVTYKTGVVKKRQLRLNKKTFLYRVWTLSYSALAMSSTSLLLTKCTLDIINIVATDSLYKYIVCVVCLRDSRFFLFCLKTFTY